MLKARVNKSQQVHLTSWPDLRLLFFRNPGGCRPRLALLMAFHWPTLPVAGPLNLSTMYPAVDSDKAEPLAAATLEFLIESAPQIGRQRRAATLPLFSHTRRPVGGINYVPC